MFTRISTLVSGIGLGAGLMYFLDPDLGRRRRALCLDQCYHAMRKLNDTAEATCKDLANRAYGTFAELRSSMIEHDNSDPVVVNRVRSKLGHFASHPSDIKVAAHDGDVTLSGHVPPQEAPKLIKAAKSVIGVNRVQSYFDIREDGW